MKQVASSNHKISIIGLPTDSGTEFKGSRLGPQALRLAGFVEALQNFNSDVIDCGDISGDLPPKNTAISGLKNLDYVLEWNQKAYEAVKYELSLGRLPIMLGGDHSLAIGSVNAAAEYCQQNNKTLKVLWMDAHTDLNTPEISPSGNIHGMPLASLLGYGPKELANFASLFPAIKPQAVHLFGIRSVDEAERSFLSKLNIDCYDMRYIDEVGIRKSLQEILSTFTPGTHIHLSYDLDFIDPNIAPGVGTAVRGGPNYREAQLCMEMLSDCGLVGSIDLIELNPINDVHNQTAILAVDLFESLFGKSTLERIRPVI